VELQKERIAVLAVKRPKEEIDLEERVWTQPAGKYKSNLESSD
jgi:hypothetical protein